MPTWDPHGSCKSSNLDSFRTVSGNAATSSNVPGNGHPSRCNVVKPNGSVGAKVTPTVRLPSPAVVVVVVVTAVVDGSSLIWVRSL